MVALFCCTLMVFTALATDVEAAEYFSASSNEQLIESVLDKVDEGLAENLSYSEIAETFTEAEWEALREDAEREADLYGTETDAISAIQLDEEQMEEVEYIDSLAQEYYNYYYGEGAQGDPSELDAIIEQNITDGPVPYSAVALQPSEIIQTLGYTYSASQIAAQLAKVGGLMLLGSALPFIHMLEIIVGAGILLAAMAVAYSAVAVGVNNQLLIWYSKHFNEMVGSKETTIRIALEEKKGVQYWYAYPAEWGGYGGIMIGIAMKNVQEAMWVVAQNVYYNNVFTKHQSMARHLAEQCSASGLTAGSPEQHIFVEDKVTGEWSFKPLNCWHYHAKLKGNVPGNTHIFFARP